MSGRLAGPPGARHHPARDWVIWAASLLLVLCAHSIALLWLGQTVPAAGPAAVDAVIIDLAPEPAASPSRSAPDQPAATEPVKAPAPPDPVPPDLAPDPAPPDPVPPDPAPAPPKVMPSDPPAIPEPATAPQPVIPDVVPPQAELALPPPRPMPPHPHEQRLPSRPHSPTASAKPATAPSPPASASAPAPVAAAPAPAQPSSTDQAQASWEANLLAHLARFKRFPAAAQRRGEQGVVLMRLTMGKDGSVLSLSMARGSGYADLDAEASAWLTRAQPLPPLPPESSIRQVEVLVPLRFMLR